MIENLDELNCPMKCIVKNKGCHTLYDGTNLSLSNSLISFATTKIIDGQVYDVCVNCENF